MPWTRWLLIACLLATLAWLSTCSVGLDPAQRRICRALPEALEDEGALVRITGERQLAPPSSVEVDYEVALGDGRLRREFVRCGFGEGELGRLDLVRAETRAGRLSEIKLGVLKRWWLPHAQLHEILPLTPLLDARPPAGLGYVLQIALNAVPLAAVDALLALAYALVYGLLGRILFGFGEVAVIGGYGTVIAVALGLSASLAWAPVLLGLGSLLAAALASLAACAMADILARPLGQGRALALVVASVGLAIAVPEGLRIAQGAGELWLRPLFRDPVLLLDASGFTVTATPMQAIVVASTAGAVAAVFAVLRGTAGGRAWRAVSEDAQAAALSGIDRTRVVMQTFAASGALAGLAGFLLVANYGGIGFASGLLLGLKALLAAVVGGAGSLGGAVLAGLIVGIAETVWSGYGEIAYKDVAILAMLVFLLVLRPGGLLGFAGRTPRPV